MKRKERIDARSLAVATSSGALVTLALALVVAIHGKDFVPNGAERAFMGLSLFGFVLAALFGVAAGLNWSYDVPDVSTLQEMIDDHWVDSEVSAGNSCAQLRILCLESLREGNDQKAWMLNSAISIQLIGVSLMAFSSLLLFWK